MSSVYGEHPKHVHGVMMKDGRIRTYSHWVCDPHIDAATGLEHGDKELQKAIIAGRITPPTPRNASGKAIATLVDVLAAEQADLAALAAFQLQRETDAAFLAAGFERIDAETAHLDGEAAIEAVTGKRSK